MRTIEECRKELDTLDEALVGLYLRRLALSKEIGRIKAEKGLAVYDKARENDILSRRTQGLQKSDAAAVEALYRTVFEVSRSAQNAISESGENA